MLSPPTHPCLFITPIPFLLLPQLTKTDSKKMSVCLRNVPLFLYVFHITKNVPLPTPPRLTTPPAPPPPKFLQLWWPLLFGLSEAMGDPSPAVRTGALSALSGILTEHGGIFSPQTWGLLFRGVVSPVFENAITDPTRPLSSEWPGQEEDPLEVASAMADRAAEEAAVRAAARKKAEEERAAKKAAVRLPLEFFFLRGGVLGSCLRIGFVREAEEGGRHKSPPPGHASCCFLCFLFVSSRPYRSFKILLLSPTRPLLASRRSTSR